MERKILKEVLTNVGLILLALAFGFFLNKFMIANAQVPTSSMETTVMAGDRILVNRLSYVFSEPKRGDIVTFIYPDDGETLYLKRVMGLPGETIEVIENSVYINGKKLEEEYDTTRIDNVGVLSEKMKLKEDEFFVLGDDRENSEDSRSADVGNIKRAYIYGRAWFVLYPGKNFGLVR